MGVSALNRQEKGNKYKKVIWGRNTESMWRRQQFDLISQKVNLIVVLIA